MTKLYSILVIIIIVASTASDDRVAAEKPLIAATNNVIKDVVEKIAGDSFDVFSILPSNVDPHSFSLTPEVLNKLDKAILLVLIDPENFEFERTIIENDLLKDKPYLTMLNYSKYGWRYRYLQGIGSNYHGAWIDPINALAVGKAVKESLSSLFPELSVVLENNLINFQKRLEEAISLIYNASKMTDMSKESALLMVPATAYPLQFLNITIDDVLFVEPEAPPSASKLAEVKDKLKKGLLTIIVMPLEKKNTKLDEIAKQLSEESGKPVVYLVIFGSDKIKDFIAIFLYNSFSILGVVENRYSEYMGHSGYGNTIILLFLVSVLIAIIIVESYIIFNYRKMEMGGY